ncbi:MAG: hypothetical protein KJ077_51055 [Anaerolineae bacterium]|nr:hypothetical protein [Anaerolineae bacterium]
MTNTTGIFLGPKAAWPGASLELDAVQGLHGGRRIFIYGTGQALVQIVAPGQHEQRYEFKLARAEVRRLLQLCIEHDLVTIKPADRPGQPDEGRPTLKLGNDIHRFAIVSKWAGVTDPRFDAIYAALLQLETRVQDLTPTDSGRFDRYYKPNRGWSAATWAIQKALLNLTQLDGRAIGRFVLAVILELINQLPLIVLAIVLLMVAYFWVEIDPAHTYGFGSALLHGFFWIQNGILTWFTGRYAWAPTNTGLWYYIGYWIGAIAVPFSIRTALQIFVLWLKR